MRSLRLRHIGFPLALLLVAFTPAVWASTLRVALYPYVPAPRDLFAELEATFERAHPGVNLELVETCLDSEGKPASLSALYYDGGLLTADADVYEVDAVLLGAMRQKGKIEPTALPNYNFHPMGVAAVSANGKTW